MLLTQKLLLLLERVKIMSAIFYLTINSEANILISRMLRRSGRPMAELDRGTIWASVVAGASHHGQLYLRPLALLNQAVAEYFKPLSLTDYPCN